MNFNSVRYMSSKETWDILFDMGEIGALTQPAYIARLIQIYETNPSYFPWWRKEDPKMQEHEESPRHTTQPPTVESREEQVFRAMSEHIESDSSTVIQQTPSPPCAQRQKTQQNNESVRNLQDVIDALARGDNPEMNEGEYLKLSQSLSEFFVSSD